MAKSIIIIITWRPLGSANQETRERYNGRTSSYALNLLRLRLRLRRHQEVSCFVWNAANIYRMRLVIFSVYCVCMAQRHLTFWGPPPPPPMSDDD